MLHKFILFLFNRIKLLILLVPGKDKGKAKRKGTKGEVAGVKKKHKWRLGLLLY